MSFNFHQNSSIVSFIVNIIQKSPSYEFRYVGNNLLDHERKMFIGESNKPNHFDELHSMKNHYVLLKHRKIVPFIVENKFIRICILDKFHQAHTVFNSNKHLWSKITGCFFSSSSSSSSHKLTVFICSDRTPKQFPATQNTPLSPFHINGGYTYPCSKQMIMIYRLEECTRVLIHELLHAFCTDNPHDSVEIKEAKTEAWTEIFWCALIAFFQNIPVSHTLMIQDGWITAQNNSIIRLIGLSHAQYGIRYTLLKQVFWNNLLSTFIPTVPTHIRKKYRHIGKHLFSQSHLSLSFTFPLS